MNDQSLFGVSYKSLGYNGNKKTKGNSPRYCIVNDMYIDKCNNTSCPLFDCSFSKIHKQITKMFKHEYPNMSTSDSRKISRRLLINTFRKNKKEENDIFSGIPEMFK